MTVSIRQQIEDGFIEVISRCLLKSTNPRFGYLAAVEPYNGETDETDGPDDFLRAYRGRSPFVLVGPGGTSFTNESVARTRFKRTITVDLYVGSNHLRTRESRHRADVVATDKLETADPGLYTLIEDLQSILSGNDLGLECVGPFNPVREDILIQEPTFTIWRVSYDSDTDAHVKPRDFGDQVLTATLLNIEEDGSPDTFNPIVQAEQDLT